MLKRFKAFADKRNIRFSEQFYIKKEHPGMPDNQVLHFLLNKNTIFLTTDRPFHNKVLAKRIQSFYIDESKIIGKKLKGIRIKHPDKLHKNELTIKDDYHQPIPEIRFPLLPTSPKSLKKLRTKRRRIKSHFGGFEHLDQVAITVSWIKHGKSTLFGIRIRVSSNVGIKAFDASENYIADAIEPEHRGIVAICYGLIYSIQLMLHSVKTQFYYDSPRIENPPEKTSTCSENRYATLLEKLMQNFDKLEFIEVTKGWFIERLRRKLVDLTRKPTNEIVMGDISEIIEKIESARLQKLDYLKNSMTL